MSVGTTSTRRAVLLALCTTAFAVLAVPAGALAATPCGEAVLQDWLDNSRIDRVYDLPCYEDAIDAIPPDLVDYTDAPEVIARAFQNASGRRLEESELQRGGVRGPAPPGEVPAVSASARAVPVPLLVLGGMSVVLLTAGALGYVSRRRRGSEFD